MRKAVVRDSDGFVENVIEIKAKANWPTPEGRHLVKATKSGSPGDTWDGANFIRPIKAVPESPTIEERLAALEAR